MKYLNAASRVSGYRKELLYVLMDYSYSMSAKDYKPSRLEGAIQAIIKLIETKARLYPEDDLGIIAFDDKAHVVSKHVAVGEGLHSLCRSIRNNNKEGGGTDFTKALELAECCMFGRVVGAEPKGLIGGILRGFLLEEVDEKYEQEPITKEATLRIIMLTDGDHCGGGCPVSVATRLKDRE